LGKVLQYRCPVIAAFSPDDWLIYPEASKGAPAEIQILVALAPPFLVVSTLAKVSCSTIHSPLQLWFDTPIVRKSLPGIPYDESLATLSGSVARRQEKVYIPLCSTSGRSSQSRFNFLTKLDKEFPNILQDMTFRLKSFPSSMRNNVHES
jgi:hypothetical protein